MKKICIVTTVSITIKAFLLDTIDYLQQNGYEVSVICDDDKTLIEVLPKGVKYIPMRMGRGIKIDEFIPNIIQLIKIFKREKYDLIQYSTPNASLYASIAALISRIPVRLYCQWGIVYVGFDGIKRNIFKTIEKLVCSISTTIEPDSYGNLEFSHRENLYKQKNSRVIWNGSASGVDLSKFDMNNKAIWNDEIRYKYGIDKNDFVFGFVGRLNKDKGINELLGAFKKNSYGR